MIQKIVGTDGLLLIANNIAFNERDFYNYEWYINGVLVSKEYQYNHKFLNSGEYVIKLIVKDKESEASSVSLTNINVHLKEQKILLPDLDEFGYSPFDDMIFGN
jgi:hypothetical protein